MAKETTEAHDAAALAMMEVVAALLDLARVNAAHAALSPAAPAWRELAAACAAFAGDHETARALRSVSQPSPYTYGSAPAFMPPGPEPTPGIPASRRDEVKRQK